MLDNGTIVRFRPDVAERLVRLLHVGQAVSVRGAGAENEFGRVIAAKEIGAPGEPPTVLGDEPPRPLAPPIPAPPAPRP